jgi:hypothetical protein
MGLAAQMKEMAHFSMQIDMGAGFSSTAPDARARKNTVASGCSRYVPALGIYTMRVFNCSFVG